MDIVHVTLYNVKNIERFWWRSFTTPKNDPSSPGGIAMGGGERWVSSIENGNAYMANSVEVFALGYMRYKGGVEVGVLISTSLPGRKDEGEVVCALEWGEIRVPSGLQIVSMYKREQGGKVCRFGDENAPQMPLEHIEDGHIVSAALRDAQWLVENGFVEMRELREDDISIVKIDGILLVKDQIGKLHILAEYPNIMMEIDTEELENQARILNDLAQTYAFIARIARRKR